MSKIETSCSSNKKSKTTTITFALAFTVAAVVASNASYGAKPPATTGLNATVCANLTGSASNWVSITNTCTIPAGYSSVMSSGIKITNGVSLDIKGSLTIPQGVTLTNSGTIIVENAGGVIPGNYALDPESLFHTDWQTGLLVLGTLANSGAITIQNQSATNTDLHGATGITVSVTFNAIDTNDPNTFDVVPGTLTNSGTITVNNSDSNARTRGIENLGTLDNSASGTIRVANRGAAGVGIYNMRYLVTSDAQFYINGTLANAGIIQVTSSGQSIPPDPNIPNSETQYGYGIYNNGHFTNSKTFTIENNEIDDGRGLYNSGTFTNYGTLTNNRGSYSQYSNSDLTTVTWGSWNELPGTMINYGETFVGDPASATGTFHNGSIMLNFSAITSYGWFQDEFGMINYGTFYNFGHISGGANQGICIDEPEGSGGCG